MENMSSLGIRFVYFFTFLGLNCQTSSYLAQVTIMKEVFKVRNATLGKNDNRGYCGWRRNCLVQMLLTQLDMIGAAQRPNPLKLS